MLIFIDTEFTDFKNAELISIGLVTEDCRHEFYAELPVDQARCSDFVLMNVLPQLRKVPDVLCTVSELKERLQQWLAQFMGQAPVTICFDFEGDWRLFGHAMGYEMPAWLHGRNIYKYLDQGALQMFFIENGLQDHHALNDAKANRHAYDAERAKVDIVKLGKPHQDAS